MADDASWVAGAMTEAVPWVGTAGITFGAITTDRVEAFLPDRPDQHNHVGGPHAAVMFGLGETASGAVGLAAFASAGDRAVPLVVRSEIRYLKLARGDLRAEAVLTRPRDEVLAELDAGQRPEFAVDVTITDANGVQTGAMTIVWTLKPHRWSGRRHRARRGASVAPMDVVIAGGHGQIALRLSTLLTGQGHTVRSIVRNPDHTDDVSATGATVVLADLEATTDEELARHLTDADAVVFAAGAGPGSTAARKETVDRDGATLLADAAARAGVRRYLLVSSTGVDTEPDPERGEVWAAYIRAKKAAEEAIRADDRVDATILRPGRLTDDPGTGRVRLAPPPVERDDVTRDDTAATLAALLTADHTIGATLELRTGDVGLAEAVAALDG